MKTRCQLKILNADDVRDLLYLLCLYAKIYCYSSDGRLLIRYIS